MFHLKRRSPHYKVFQKPVKEKIIQWGLAAYWIVAACGKFKSAIRVLNCSGVRALHGMRSVGAL